MPQIEIEPDVLAQLRLEARKDNGDVSACIRRLIEHANAKKTRKRGTIDHIPDELSPDALKEQYPTAILRFMCLLGWLAKKHGSDFSMAQHYKGRGGRVYIAKSPNPILESGNSTNPKQIPESEYWVCTNLSNKLKGQIMDGVMTILDYPGHERREWVAAVETDHSGGIDSSWVEETEYDDDDMRI